MAPASNGSHPEQEKNHHVAASPAVSSLPEIDPVALVHGVYVVVVHSRPEGRSPRWTRRIMLSMHSAQKAVDRATMRGDRAYLVLCQLQAVDTRLGGAL